jgi:hypothetical protein
MEIDSYCSDPANAQADADDDEDYDDDEDIMCRIKEEIANIFPRAM